MADGTEPPVHALRPAQQLPTRWLRESPSNPRASSSWGDLEGLHASMCAQGFRQEHPLLVRRLPGDEPIYEIVTGHRRFRAAQAVGMDEVPCVIDDSLDDLAVLELQLVENAQRQDVHPLDEGEAYRRLRDEHRQTAPQIARKVGKSQALVHQRLSLTALVPEAKAALLEDKLALGVAFELSRLPRPTMQSEALAEILRPRQSWERELSAKRIIEEIRSRYFLRLADARWEMDDAQLVVEAGSCASCPKRTGTQPGLFADLEADDTCLDGECFGRKGRAAKERRIEDWKARGARLLGEREAKALFQTWEPHGVTYGAQFIDLDEHCIEDPDGGLWWQLVGERLDPMTVAIAVDPTGTPRELATKDGAAKALLAAGYAWASKAETDLATSSAGPPRKGKESKAPSDAANKWKQERESERRHRVALLTRASYGSSKATALDVLREFARGAMDMATSGEACGVLGLKDEAALVKHLDAAKEPELVRAALLLRIAAVQEYDDPAPEDLAKTPLGKLLKKVGADPVKIAAETTAAIATESKVPVAKVPAKASATKPSTKKPSAAKKKPARSPAKKGGAR